MPEACMAPAETGADRGGHDEPAHSKRWQIAVAAVLM